MQKSKNLKESPWGSSDRTKNMAKDVVAVTRADYSAKARSQGLHLVPDPDRHIHPSHVPDDVVDKVAECIEHSKQVLQRRIGTRQKRLISSLGAAWDINKAPVDGPYYLQCARSDICDSFEYVLYIYVIYVFFIYCPHKTQVRKHVLSL